MFQTPVAALQQVQLPQHPLCPKLTLMACDTEDLTHQTFLSFLYTSEFPLFPEFENNFSHILSVFAEKEVMLLPKVSMIPSHTL